MNRERKELYMEFKTIKEKENVKIILIDAKNECATATCYFENTPKVNGKNIGCVGEFTCKSEEYGIQIIKKCEEILKSKNVELIVAPMNGNTWKKYRTMKYTNGEDLFLLENVNPIEHNSIFLKTGFKERYTYTSTKGLLKNAYKSKAIDIVKKRLKEKNINIRKFDKENYIEDLKKIYSVSKQSFYRNPLYTPINEQEFIEQYEQYINMIDDDLVLIAEDGKRAVGFIFVIPDYNEKKQGKELKTIVVKTVAVLPEYGSLALGNVLLGEIAEIAIKKDYEQWICAFMYSNNTSQKMAKRNKTELIREYALYNKQID